MPKIQTDYLGELLNRLEAMLDCGAVQATELAERLLPDQGKAQAKTRVSEWLRARSRKPNGETALRMQEFAAEKTLAITADAKLAKEYRKAFKDVQTRRS